MREARKDVGRLAGKEVAFTGRLASMSRVQARELVRTQGGNPVPAVNATTSILVVGQAGWPLKKNGKLTSNLERARLLVKAGQPLSIITEEDFLASLGLDAQATGVHRYLTLPQLCTVAGVSSEQLRAWLRMGLLAPVQTVENVAYFDFQQVAGLKNAVDLLKSGVSSDRLKKSFGLLRRLLPDAEEPLSQISRLAESGLLLVRLPNGQVADPAGQLYFDYGAQSEDEPSVVQFQSAASPSAESWFEHGCDLEDTGKLPDAADAYRQALLIGGPNTDICFNLANVLTSMGQRAQACERFRQVLELEPGRADAWNNLGNVLVDRGEFEEALSAYREAVRVDPCYGDARYNLADLLDRLGRTEEARSEWRLYLRHDNASPWARFARSRLG